MGRGLRRPDFYIIDGSSMMYRAIHSPGPAFTSPSGEPTGGTYIFTRLLLKLLREKRPEYIIMALDVRRETLHRRKIFPGYKKGRKSTLDDERFKQLKRMVQITRALGVRTIRVKRWEADDVIATLSRTIGPGKRTVIVSGDKDLHQLVRKWVVCYDPIHEEFTRREDVELRWGVRPNKVVEVQTLMGDPTDSIPGVRGVGPKKALELIQEYKTAKKVWKVARRADSPLTPALRAAILEADWGVLRTLVRLRTDLDLDIDEGDLEFNAPDMDAAQPIFEELGFRSLAESRKTRESILRRRRK